MWNYLGEDKMRKKFAAIFLSIIFLSSPLISHAEQTRIQMSANTITVNTDGLVEAEGNVIVRHDAIIIKADALLVDKRNNSFSFSNIREFYDGQAIKFSAKGAEMNDELTEGLVLAANLLLDDTIKIKADKVHFENREISKATGISRVTSCEECAGQEPNWHFSASSASRDSENANIVYRNVTLRLKDLPVAYLPYLRMPDPSVDRARGFLVPEAALTSNLATGLKLPYFIPIGLSSDILLTPYFSSKTKTLEFRYRQKFRNGDVVVNGAIASDELKKNKFRYFAKALGSFELGYGVKLNFDFGKVSDNSFLGDYVYSEESDLDAKIVLGKTVVQKKQYFEGNLSYLREKNQGTILDEYYSLSGTYEKETYQTWLPGKLRMIANLNSSLNVSDKNIVSRPPSSAQLGVNYNQLNYFGPMKFSSLAFGRLNSFVNSENSGNTKEEFSFQYGYSSLISTPLIREGDSEFQILIPKISLSFNGQENDILGDFFIGSDELSWGNLYSGKKITSLTESETKLSMSMGIEHQIVGRDGRQLQIEVAASKVGHLTYTSETSYGIPNDKFNYLGRFSYFNPINKAISGNILFSSDGKLLNGDLRGEYFHKKFKVKGKYEFISRQTDTRLLQDSETVNYTSTYEFLDSLIFKTGGRYDFVKEKMGQRSVGLGVSMGFWDYNFEQEYLKERPDKLSISAVYDDNCTRLTFSFENRYQELGSSEPVKALTFRVQLKPFANVVFSQGSEQITF